MRNLAHHRYTWDQYLALERDANVRHEFLDGEIYAMAGGTMAHAQLAGRVIRDLGANLRGKPCDPYPSDLSVRVEATGLATYPDVTVLCSPVQRDPQAKNTALNPTVIVEVLSNSTEDYDRGQKFVHYQQIASLQEYVLISHRERLIEVFRRAAGWAKVEARSGAKVQLESIGGELAVDSIYEGVTLED